VTVHRPPARTSQPTPVRAFSADNLTVLFAHLLIAEATRRASPNQPSGRTMHSSDRPTLSVAETAELLGVSRWLVQQAVRDGSLPSRRIGRRILIPAARLEAWLQGEAPPGAADAAGPARQGAATPPRPGHVRAV
jgi:excisionase family DNA binding protein